MSQRIDIQLVGSIIMVHSHRHLLPQSAKSLYAERLDYDRKTAVVSLTVPAVVSSKLTDPECRSVPELG